MAEHLPINQASLEKLVRERREPCWLADKRFAAFENFKKLPLLTIADSPTQKQYTNLTEQELKGLCLDLPKKDPLPEIVSKYAGLLDQSQAFGVFENLRRKFVEGKEKLSKRGIVFTSLRNAVSEYPDLVQRHLNKAIQTDSQKFGALAAACWQDGAFLYIPPHTHVKLPIKTLFATQGSNIGWFSHSIVIVEEGSELDYVEIGTSPEAERNAWHSDVVEVFAGARSRVNCYSIQQWSRNSYNFGFKKACLGEEAEMNWVVATFGARISKVTVENALLGPRTVSGNFGVFLGGKNQHIDISNNAYHPVPDTHNEIFTRGALMENATSVYRGLIKINKEAKHTDSNMAEYTLLLSNRAKANATPTLEIDTNDVHAKHAAAVGQIDKDQMFYLMSRGLDRAAAERLVIRGFFEPVLQNVKLQQVRTAISEVIEDSVKNHEPQKAS